MRKVERDKLLKALDHLESNPCEWENAMEILYPLAGLEYKDVRKMTGKTISLMDAVSMATLKERT